MNPAPARRSLGSVPIELIVSEGCHACLEAKALVEQVSEETGIPYAFLEIGEHPELLALHAEEVPVLYIDGRMRDFWRIDPDRFRRLLAEPREQGAVPRPSAEGVL